MKTVTTTTTTAAATDFRDWTWNELSDELDARQRAAENHRVAIGRDSTYDDILAEVAEIESEMDSRRA